MALTAIIINIYTLNVYILTEQPSNALLFYPLGIVKMVIIVIIILRDPSLQDKGPCIQKSVAPCFCGVGNPIVIANFFILFYFF